MFTYHRLALGLCPLALLLSTGCMTPSNSQAGWRFEYLKPPTIQQSQVVVSGAPPLGLVGSSTYGNVPMTYAPPQVASQPTLILPAQPAPQIMVGSRTTSDCLTLQQACDRITALEATRPAMVSHAGPERLPMPKGAPASPPMPAAPCP